jgi:hypothetical protein
MIYEVRMTIQLPKISNRHSQIVKLFSVIQKFFKVLILWCKLAFMQYQRTFNSPGKIE